MIQRHQPGCGRHPAGMVAARLERGSAGWSFFWYSWPRWWLPSRAGSVSRTVWGPHLLLDRGWGGGGRGAVAESGAERVGWCGDRHWVYRRGFGVSAEHRGQPGREGRDHRGGDLCLGGAGGGCWGGQLALAAMATALVIFCLELQHIPALQVLDARHWQHRFADDKPDAKPPSTNSEPRNPSGTQG